MHIFAIKISLLQTNFLKPSQGTVIDIIIIRKSHMDSSSRSTPFLNSNKAIRPSICIFI